MITSKNRLTRRTVLRGAGGVAIGLPFLEAMLRPGQSHAATSIPLRFLVFYTPGGTLLDKWRPTGTSTAYMLGDMLSALNPWKDRMLFVDGLDMNITQIGVGHPHSRGMAGLLTGTKLNAGTFDTGQGLASWADGPSVDQVIASRINKGLNLKFPSLEFSSGWAISGRSAGQASYAANTINYNLPTGSTKNPIAPQVDQLAAFKRIWGTGSTGAGGMSGTTLDPNARTKSILDAVQSQFTALSGKLGASDRATLQAHLDMIRQSEMSLTATTGGGGATCTTPDKPMATNSTLTGSMQSGTGVVVTESDIPQKGLIMTDLLVASLACDMTRVATMQWADSEAKFIMNFDPLGLPDHHHAYQHEHGFNPDALFKIYKWYAGNFAYLLQKMDAVKEADGSTLLDNTLIFWVTEIQKPDSHEQTSMPLVLAGKAQGKYRTGRWVQVPKGTSHNNLLVTILNIFGGTDTTFGDAKYCTGALAGIT
jgi:hypothetical protein